MLTIATALPWEAARFTARLRARRRTPLGEGWAIWGERGHVLVRVIVSGPGEDRAAAAAAALRDLDPPATGILSTGVSAGLVDGLRPGHAVLAARVLRRRTGGGSGGAPIGADHAFRQFLADALERSGVRWREGDLLQVDRALLTPHEKREQHAHAQAVAAAMEDYAWAAAARDLGLPFVAMRVVLDPVGARIPDPVLAWDWRGPAGLTVAAGLARRPWIAPALVRLGWRRRAAIGAIDRVLEAVVARPPTHEYRI